MIEINWRLPSIMFKELDRLLDVMPTHTITHVLDSVNLDEMLAGIDLGGFNMVRKELSDDDLHRFVSRVAPGDAFTVNGQAVALYIEDRKSQKPHHDYDLLPKVHLVNCGISFREGRYVQVVNPNGKFDVIFRGGVRVERELRICGLCKKSIRAQKRGWVGKFNLQSKDGRTIDWSGWNKFIVTHPESLPKHKNVSSFSHAGTRSPDSYGYTPDWDLVSAQFRAAAGWCCQICRVNLSNDKKFLHGHHRNRNKQDNSESNIAILCHLCHREEGFSWKDGDDHELLVGKDWIEAIKVISKRRSEQGILWHDTPACKPPDRPVQPAHSVV